MADEKRVVLMIDNGGFGVAVAHLQNLNDDRMTVSPLYDRDYDLRDSDYFDTYVGYDDIHEEREPDPYDIDQLLLEDFAREVRSYDDLDNPVTHEEIDEWKRLRDEAIDQYLPPYSSCRSFGPRKEYKLAHSPEDERFGRRRWTDSKDHLRRKVRSRFYRKERLMQSSSLTDHDATDPLDAFLDESEVMEEVVALRAMGFHDLAARL